MTPIVCVGYLSVKEEEAYLRRSMECMWDWVDWFVVLDTDGPRPAELDPKRKLLRVGEDYGRGLDVSLKAGGFDQIAARDRLAQLCASVACDWFGICDADEFFTPDVRDTIAVAEQEGKRAIQVRVLDYVSPTKRFLPRGHGSTRWFKRGLKFRYVVNTTMRGLNETQHCHPQVAERYILDAREQPLWVHTRNLLGPKREEKRDWLASQELLEADSSVLPVAIQSAWAASQNCSDI